MKLLMARIVIITMIALAVSCMQSPTVGGGASVKAVDVSVGVTGVAVSVGVLVGVMVGVSVDVEVN